MSSNNTEGLRKLLPSVRTSEVPPSEPPARSQTDPPSPEEHRREKSHLHQRLHSHGLRNRAFTGSHGHHHHRHGAKEVVQSAIELKPPISFDSLLRRDKKHLDSSRHSSNSASHNQRRTEEERRAQQAQQARRRQIQPEDVQKAKRDNERRQKELRESLKNVEEVAMSSTRQLDDTYYAILEKVSLLMSTVASLQRLAEESRNLHTSFREQSGRLEEDTVRTFKGFENFDSQEKAINELLVQLKSSKDQRDRIGQRLEAARNRVEAYERREKEKKQKSRMRWSVIWAVFLAVVALIVAFFTTKKHGAVGGNVPSVAKVLELASSITALNPIPRATVSEDPYLKKLFDEL